MSRSERIVDARFVGDQLLVRIDGPNAPRGPRKKGTCIVAIYKPWLVEDLARASRFEVRDDGRKLHWLAIDRSIAVDELLDWHNGSGIYVLPWSSKTLESIATLRQITGCWKTPGGYILLKRNGNAHIKLVDRRFSWDVAGDCRWENAGGQSFRLFCQQGNLPMPKPDSIFKIIRFNGEQLELKQCVTLSSTGKQIEMPVVWMKWERPKSWERL